jgi:ankyrin repeat protein
MPNKRKKKSKLEPPNKKVIILLNDDTKVIDEVKRFLLENFKSVEEIDWNNDPSSWLNKKDINGNTPLFIACQLENSIAIDIFRLYPDAITEQQKWAGCKNPFHVACFHNYNVTLLQQIKKKDKNNLIHEIDSNGRTPLFYAKTRHLKWLKREGRVEVNLKDNDGQTAFHYNCAQLNFDYCNKIMKGYSYIETNEIDDYGYNPFVTLVMAMFEDIKNFNEDQWNDLSDLLSYFNKDCPDAINHRLENNKNILHFICKHYKQSEEFQSCFIKKIIRHAKHLVNECDAEGLTPIHLACHYEADFIKILSDTIYGDYGNQNIITNKYICINEKDCHGKTAFHHACEIHNYTAFSNLIKFKYIDIDLIYIMGNTALHAIFVTNDCYCPDSVMMIKKILKLSPYMVYQRNSLNSTALDMLNEDNNESSIYQRNYDTTIEIDENVRREIIEILNNAFQATLNKPNDDGNTAFHFACEPKSDTECDHIEKLLHNPNLLLNVRNNKGRTPFHDACFYSYSVLVQKLIQHPGININITDYGGENALHHIIQGYIKKIKPRDNDHCLETIHCLLKTSPFLVNIKNSAYETPLDYVRLMNKDRGGLIFPKINGKQRKIYCQNIDRKFWATLLTTLEHYQHQARLVIFNYLMENNN